jgi:pimeloyl-ACP methyl ester carboxylesterase
MSIVNYNGNKIWYEETGRGDPLVFLHNVRIQIYQ